MSKIPGCFISFEGLDGSGKTTQSKLLQQYLKSHLNITCLWTREPGGTKLGEDIRNLLEKYTTNIDGYTIFLLLMASRRQHINELIKPNVANGYWVISDRFIDSTLAYQKALDGISFDFILKEHQEFSIDYWPDVTFFLDISPDEANLRLSSSLTSDYYDNLVIKRKNLLRTTFLTIAKMYPDRIEVIDGSESLENIHKNIIAIINKKLLNK
jgi:dTMP kinase